MKKKNKYPSFILIFTFLLISLIFNYRIFKEIFDFTPQKVFTNDGMITEFLTETSYQNLLKLKNPFTTNKIFYPFETNFSLTDPSYSNVFFLFFLRPFFDSYYSLLIIVLLNIFLGNMFMFLLLRRLKINQYIAFISSLIFGFMPFISHRIVGHYTYTSIYVFPLIFLLVYNLINHRDPKKRLFVGFALGISLAFTILTNFYYFIIVIFGILFYLLFFFFQKRELLIAVIKKNIGYLLLSLSIFLIILIPWFIEVYKLIYFDGLVKTSGFGGSQNLSADFISFFLPSEFNPIYKSIFLKIQGINPFFIKASRFFFSSWDRFAYPGIIILIGYLFIIFLKKRLPSNLWQKIKPHFLISLFFALLSMGPFLKILNRWAFPLGDGINFVLPLPFLILHYLPGSDSVRAPMRFNPGFVFLAAIVGAFLLDYFYKKVTLKRNRFFFILIIFLVFLVDQFYIIPPELPGQIPIQAYQYIKNDQENSSVLEIPFTIRDGFNYLGFVHAITIMKGPLIYDKPVIGGYLARVDKNIFNYYESLPLIGYISKIIDKGNYDPYKEKPKEPNIFPFDGNIESVKKEIDFLDIKYIVLKNNEKYSNSIEKVIKKIGFTKKLTDNNYDLFVKEITKENFEKVNFGNNDDNLLTAAGFSFREDGFRWVQGKLAKVFIKTTNIKKQKLIFEGLSFFQPQTVKVYINKQYIGEKEVSTDKKSYALDITDKLKPGINTVYFRFSKSFVPAKLWSHDKDMRDLAAKFFSLKIE